MYQHLTPPSFRDMNCSTAAEASAARIMGNSPAQWNATYDLRFSQRQACKEMDAGAQCWELLLSS